MKNINYRTNSQLWNIEDTAAAAGYEKTSDCYWCQIFTNAATGDQFTTTREESSTNDPAADLAVILAPSTEPAAPVVTESRIMDADDLRALCIEKEWYTYGNNEEYARLFQRLDNPDGTRAEMTPAKLYEIAEDIRRASDWRWTAPAIMFELARICRSFFEIV